MILYVNYVIIKFIKAIHTISTLRNLLYKKILGKWRNIDYYTRFIEGAEIFVVLIPLITMAFLSRFGQNIANNINQKNHKKIFVQFLICLFLTSASILLAQETNSKTGEYLACVCFGGTGMLFFSIIPVIKQGIQTHLKKFATR
mgnify:CR=1 FL=1